VQRILLFLSISACGFLAIASGAQAATLRAPSLNAPANEAAVEASPTFTWNAVKNAATYEFQLSADQQFGSVAQTVKTKNTAATLKGTLIDGTYYWRARAVSAGKKAGRWSSVREVVKRWKTAPELLSPTTDFGAVWPTSPLALSWSAVPHATEYIVVVETDESLAQPVLGTATRPQTTTGTTLALRGTLNAGTYYWQITPVDTDGHKGTPSVVGRFTWSWPSGLTAGVQDLNAAAEVFDPLLTWTAVPGATSYDVEVNTTPDFAPGSLFYSASVVGTSVAPTKQLPNNRYYWRVRAVDADKRAGGWFGGEFRKEFDDVPVTVPNVRLNDATGGRAMGDVTSSPYLTWDPVPGAAEYELQVLPWTGTQCNYGSPVLGGPTDPIQTHVPAAQLADDDIERTPPGPSSWPGAKTRYTTALSVGSKYCVRILARDGAGVALKTNANDSEWTYVNGFNQPVFEFATPPTVPPDASYAPLPKSAYQTPADGSSTTRTPIYRWEPSPQANSYWVVISRDDALTEVIETAFVRSPYYIPLTTLADEGTSYYWVVFPSNSVNGDVPSIPDPSAKAYPRFLKQSVPPALSAPAGGASIGDQPVFSWGSVEGAKSYRVQVARDAQFRDLLDNVETASTAYAPIAGSYPVGAELFWRVRAEDADKVQLNWSEVRSFQRTLPAPTLDPGNPTTGSGIPVFAWTPVQGAVSYGLHVDKVDGGTEDFTVASPRFAPTKFYGNGIWKWKVRANFPASSGIVSGAYTGSVDYLRRILPPTNTKAVRTSKRLVFSWDPDSSGKKYRLEVAEDDSFSQKIESVTTPNTSYAPLLTQRGYEDGGKIYWRVAILDDGNNLGAFARGDLRLPPRLQLKTKVRRLKRGTRTAVLITVTDPRGTRIRNATVKFAGAGIKGTRKTGKKGTVTLRLRPKKKATVKITASRKGYVAGTLSLRAY